MSQRCSCIDNYDSLHLQPGGLHRHGRRRGARGAKRRDRRRRRRRLGADPPGRLARARARPPRPASRAALIERAAGRIPVLGVCLGHQVICELYGGTVGRAGPDRARQARPGAATTARRSTPACPSPFEAGRYHSLAASARCPTALEVTARTPDGEVMGVRHRELAVHGVQFHPESVLTPHGRTLIANFLAMEGTTAVITDAIKTLVEGHDLSAEETARRHDAGDERRRRPAADLRLPGRAADEGRDARRDRRLRPGDARARHARAAARGRTWSTPAAPAATAPNTFNISTSAALVAAGAGAPVAKHGNRAVSQRCGLGRRAGGARRAHRPRRRGRRPRASTRSASASSSRRPTTRPCATPARCGASSASARCSTCSGPLTNPAGARRQVIGVYAESLVEPIAQVLAQLGAEHALVVHGAGGLDELTPTGENLMAEVRDGDVTMRTLDPRPLSTGPAPGTPEDLRCGGDPAQNAAIIRTVFDGERGPRRDAVILNAAAALLVGGLVADFEHGIDARRRDDRLRRGDRQAGRAGGVHPRRGRRWPDERLPGDAWPATSAATRRSRRAGSPTRLRPGRSVAVVAEIKRASPSQGAIADDVDVAEPSHRAYAAGGAAAISVLCAERDFAGSLDDLAAARAQLAAAGHRQGLHRVPASRSPRSAWPAPTRSWSSWRWSSDGEAAGCCSGRAARAWTRSSRRTTRPRSSARSPSGARVVGVNARDLRDARVDRERQLELVCGACPSTVVRVAESGIYVAGRRRGRAATPAPTRCWSAPRSCADPELLAELPGCRGDERLVKICGLDPRAGRRRGGGRRRRPGRLRARAPSRRDARDSRARPRAGRGRPAGVADGRRGRSAGGRGPSLDGFDLVQTYDRRGLPRARSWPPRGEPPAQACRRACRSCSTCAFGSRPDPADLREHWRRAAGVRAPVVLAGSLTPDNVAEAVAAARPWAVDTARGVETEPGVKDAELIERFVAAARGAS